MRIKNYCKVWIAEMLCILCFSGCGVSSDGNTDNDINGLTEITTTVSSEEPASLGHIQLEEDTASKADTAENSAAKADEQRNFTREDFAELEAMLAVEASILRASDENTWDYVNEIFDLEQLDIYDIQSILDAYVSCLYSEGSTQNESFDSVTGRFSVSEENFHDMLRVVSGRDISDEEFAVMQNWSYEDGIYYCYPNEMTIFPSLNFVYAEQKGENIILLVNGYEHWIESKFEDENFFTGCWEITLREDPSNAYGYAAEMFRRIHSAVELSNAPEEIRNPFEEMEYEIDTLLEYTNENYLDTSALPENVMEGFLQRYADGVGFGADWYVGSEEEVGQIIRDYFGYYPDKVLASGEQNLFEYRDGSYYFLEASGVNADELRVIKVIPDGEMTDVFVNRVSYLDFLDESDTEPAEIPAEDYYDTWKITFIKDEGSRFGCHVVSLEKVSE